MIWDRAVQNKIHVNNQKYLKEKKYKEFMDKIKLNYMVDVGLFITFLAAGITGILKLPILFKLGITRGITIPIKIIDAIHDFGGLLMVVLVVIHLILHWKWIVLMTKKYCGKNNKK